MLQHMVVKIRWRKSRSKDAETKGSPICSIHVNDSEVVSVMAPDNTPESLETIRRYAILLWIQNYFGNAVLRALESKPKITTDLIAKAISVEGYNLLSTMEEGGVEIYFIVKQVN